MDAVQWARASDAIAAIVVFLPMLALTSRALWKKP